MDLSDLSTLIQQLSTKKVPDASNMCFGIVVSENKADISGNLLRGCVLTLEEHGALPENIHIKTVPSAFQLVYGANQMTLTGNYDAVILLGCIIRGETSQFDLLGRGIYEGISGRRYKFGCIKENNEYLLIYLGEQERNSRWNNGDINPNRSLGPISSCDVKVFSCSPESKECLPLIHGSHKT